MQPRRLLIALVFGTAAACLATAASAQQVYKWKDANGVTHFSQTPPPAGKHYTKMHLQGQPEVSTPPRHSASSQENRPQGDEDGAPPARTRDDGKTEPDTPDNRARLCKQLRSNIALLQSKEPVVTGGQNGKQQVMSDNAREQQLATARAQQAQYCSGG